MTDIVTLLQHTYHLADVPDTHPIRRACAEILRLREEAERMRQIAVEARRDADAAKRAGWIARSERMPEEGVPVLIVDIDNEVDIAHWNGDDEWWTYTRMSYRPDAIDWWMPLPEPPQGDPQ